MNGIREFRRDDIGRVARLWMKVFRARSRPASPALQEYFRDIFFDNPWRGEGLPSLVYEDGERQIVGFLGVIPRRMRFRGESLRVAVATQLMVDESRCPAYAAARMLRRFLAGPQDLSLSDGANPAGEKLWRACGGEVAVLHSLQWTRVLRPAQHLRARLRQRPRLALAALPAWPLAWSVDACLERSGLSRWRPAPSAEAAALEEGTLDEHVLLQGIAQPCVRRALMPEYSAESLRWLLRHAADKRNHGRLRSAALRRPGGALAGWYLYYLERGGVAQVLQFGAMPGLAPAVIDRLLGRAFDEGAVAITGGVEPRFVKELSVARCGIAVPGCYTVLVHARREDIAQAVHGGDALLTRLEGEWWARFSDAEWSAQADAPAGAAPTDMSGPQLKAVH